jgi:hypothetical protein
LIEYYRERGLLSALDGSAAIETVHRRLVELFAVQGLK